MMSDVVDAWYGAVEAGGRGEIADALTRLTRLRRHAVGNEATTSLTWSTAASFYRQAGRHVEALILDGRAANAAAPVVGFSPMEQAGWRRAALADAVVGLAADNLGLARFGASRRLLSRAQALLADTGRSHPDTWEAVDWHFGGRGWLRYQWVGAELAMYLGDGVAAVECARSAVATARGVRAGITTRHRIKTDLIAAAACACIGDTTAAACQARAVSGRAAEAELPPLEWAALSLLSGVDAASVAERERLLNLRCRLREQGMPFAPGTDR